MNEEQRRAFKVFLALHGLTIATFAARCGVSRQYISSIVSGYIPLNKTIKELFIKGGYCIYE